MWNEKMKELLGISTENDYCNGPMQDVHWPEGLFGYFPCYTLGALYAAQWKAMICEKYSSFDDIVGKHKLTPILSWLDQNIWKKASTKSTQALTRDASNGKNLATKHFRNHLENRYLSHL